MMRGKRKIVIAWIMLTLILLGMIGYAVFFINGASEGTEETDEMSVIAQEAMQE